MEHAELKEFILQKLESELPSNLLYHNVNHTLDVYKAAVNIANNEEIKKEEIALLKIAALYHDTGFIKKYVGHEEVSCEIARSTLSDFNYPKRQIDVICNIIMATKVPQRPKNHLEEILCDADLDYLGTDDFYTIGNKLYHEFKELGIVRNERQWNKMQLDFLKKHEYFTETSKMQREPVKQKHLEQLREIVKY